MICFWLLNEILKEIDFVYILYYNFEKLLLVNNILIWIYYYRLIKSRGKFIVYFFVFFKLFCKCLWGVINSYGE